MFHSISADFYSSDEAEIASLNIKNQIKNIKTIDIINHDNNSLKDNTNNSYGFTGLVTNNVSSNYTPIAFGFFGTAENSMTNNTDFDYTKKGSNITLKLSCDEKDLPLVSNLLTSYGGHNIEKI